MPDISGGELCPSRNYDSRNLSIPHINSQAVVLSSRCQQCGCLRGRLIKIKHPSFQVFNHEFVEGCFKRSSTSPLRKKRQAESRLEQRDAGYPNGLGRLAI